MRVRRARWPLMATLAFACLPAARAGAQDCTFVVEGTTWLWQPEPGPADWAEPEANDDPEESDWRLGCAPFSSNGCGFAPGTDWAPNTDLVARQHVFLTGAEYGLVADVAIDNDFELYVNGSFVSSLVHEGCATRWDASVAVPDGLWVAGDNVLALRLVDRGGISNFEMSLRGSSADPCPSGCARLPCSEPGPALALPLEEVCPGQVVSLRAEAPPDPRCPSAMEYRFLDPLGRGVLRGWGGPAWHGLAAEDGLSVVAQVRCAHSPTCPIGEAEVLLPPRPGPPLDPGPVLRVGKAPGGVRVAWSAAPALPPAEHEHLIQSDAPDGLWSLLSGEGFPGSSWLDPRPGAPRHYLLRRADACERESPAGAR